MSFQLSGDDTPTYLANSYRGTAIYAGWNANHGSLYQVSGSFSGTDAASNKFVNGSVSLLVGIKGHSGRDGGNQYLAVIGSMTIKLVESKSAARPSFCASNDPQRALAGANLFRGSSEPFAVECRESGRARLRASVRCGKLRHWRPHAVHDDQPAGLRAVEVGGAVADRVSH